MKETGLTGKRRSTTIAATPDDGNSQRKRRVCVELSAFFIRAISLSRRLRPSIQGALSLCRCFRPFKLGLSVCAVLSAVYIMPFMAAKSVPELSALIY